MPIPEEGLGGGLRKSHWRVSLLGGVPHTGRLAEQGCPFMAHAGGAAAHFFIPNWSGPSHLPVQQSESMVQDTPVEKQVAQVPLGEHRLPAQQSALERHVAVLLFGMQKRQVVAPPPEPLAQ